MVRVLGRGGMGEVHLVHDGVRQQQVALKRVLAERGDAMVRFKREFRAIERLLHPGLVRLHELGEDAEGLYFTMEAIDGVDLLTYCTGGPFPPFPSNTRPGSGRLPEPPDPFAPTLGSGDVAAPETSKRPSTAAWQLDLDRLVHVLPQLVEALAFLHASGYVHRDLKPANIMVRRDGVAKLLDFGVLGELRPRRSTGRREVVGTIGYMAPEQLTGEAPTPASDLYALGATLFQVASGQPVFQGTTSEVVARHLTAEPPLLSDVAPKSPPALVQTCRALLGKEPSRRPALGELSRLLLEPLGARRPIFSAPRTSRPPLEGRWDEQAQLRERLERLRAGGATFEVLVFSGPTGAGKTSLLDWLGDEADRLGMTVLRGRGRPSERVPFNALDRCIDGLALRLGPRRHKGPPGRWTRVAASVFPVLARPGPEDAAPAEVSRAAAFAALTVLLTDEGEQAGGLLLLVDDLQWADDDSIALLDHLVGSAPAPILVAATLRDDVDQTPASRWLDTTPRATVLPVRPLAAAAIEAIIERCARQAGLAPEADALARAVEACGGHPYLAELAGRALGRREEVVAGRAVQAAISSLLASVDVRSRELLALMVAADEWTRVGDLAAWAARTPGDVLDGVSPLERDGLVRVAGFSGPDQSVDLYHSAVREAALGLLTAEQMRTAHGRIADWLERGPSRSLPRLVRHLRGAGREEDAATLAPEAAAQAETQRAFALAAELYEVALQHPNGRRGELLRRRAGALERSGHYRSAAGCWRELAELTAGAAETPEGQNEALVDAMLHEAHALLAAGDQREGRRRLDEALARSGEPAVGGGGLSGLVAGLRFLIGPGQATTSPGAPAPAALVRAERDVRVGQMVSYFDVLSGIRFLRRARRSFVREAAAEQAARCDYLFAYFAMFGTRQRGPVPLAERYLRAAAAHLEGRTAEDHEVRNMPGFLAGVAAQRDGRWADGVAALDEVVDELERQGVQGTFEHLMALVHRTQLDLFGQDMAALEGSLARLRAAVHGTGDSAMRCHLVFCEALRALLLGELERCAELGRDLAARWQMDQPSYQRFIVSMMLAAPALYRSDCVETRRELARVLRRDRAFRPLKTMYGGLYAAFLALAEVNALRSGDGDASARRCQRYAALAREATPELHVAAWRARAYAEDARGRPERALALLEQAEQEAARFGQQIDVAVARYQRGRRLGGDAGQALIQQARSAMERLGAGTGMLEEDAGLR